MKTKQLFTKFFFIFSLLVLTACDSSIEQAAATMVVQTAEAGATGTAIIEEAVSNALTQAAPVSTSTLAFTPTLTPTPPNSPTPTSNPEEFSDIDPSGNTILMRLVPAGEFTMGSTDDAVKADLAECLKKHDEIRCGSGDYASTPLRQVEVDAFYMDQYKVTNALYKACVDANVCEPPIEILEPSEEPRYGEPEFDNYPVRANWYKASIYCEWRGARLPTEAEWEKSARSTDGRTYPWGEDLDCTKYNCGHYPVEVGSYERGVSPYGIYDLLNNACEWVNDWYAAYPGNSIQNSNYGTRFRVVRGCNIRILGSSVRDHYIPNKGATFRCARSLAETDYQSTNTSAPTNTPTAVLTTIPLATPEKIPLPQQWNGWLSYGSEGTQNLSFIIDRVEGTAFYGKMVWQSFGKRAKGATLLMHGEYISDFGDSWEQNKWSYHEDYKKGDRSGTWLKWTETEIIEGANYTVNGWYYAHIRENGTMKVIYFYSADATIPSNDIFTFTLVQP